MLPSFPRVHLVQTKPELPFYLKYSRLHPKMADLNVHVVIGAIKLYPINW